MRRSWSAAGSAGCRTAGGGVGSVMAAVRASPAAWLTRVSVIRTSPTSAAAPAWAGLHAVSSSVPRPRRRRPRRGGCGSCGSLRCGRPEEESIHEVARPGQQLGVAQRRAADPSRAGTRYQDGTDRRLDDAARVEPGQPDPAGVGELDRREADVRPCSVTSVRPAVRACARKRGHLEQVLDRLAAAARSGRRARRAPPSTSASEVDGAAIRR